MRGQARAVISQMDVRGLKALVAAWRAVIDTHASALYGKPSGMRAKVLATLFHEELESLDAVADELNTATTDMATQRGSSRTITVDRRMSAAKAYRLCHRRICPCQIVLHKRHVQLQMSLAF